MNFQVKSIILATTLLLLNTNSVQANWQFTEWGMTAEQLKKVSPVPIEGGDKCPVNNSNRSTNKYDVKYASDWVAGDMIFIACYIFYQEKLHAVNLYSKQVDSESIIKGLSQKYGRPTQNDTLTKIGLINYLWDLPNEKIEFQVFTLNDSNRTTDYPYGIFYKTKAGSNEEAVQEKL